MQVYNGAAEAYASLAQHLEELYPGGSDVNFFMGTAASSVDAALYPHLLFHLRAPVSAPELRTQVRNTPARLLVCRQRPDKNLTRRNGVGACTFKAMYQEFISSPVLTSRTGDIRCYIVKFDWLQLSITGASRDARAAAEAPHPEEVHGVSGGSDTQRGAASAAAAQRLGAPPGRRGFRRVRAEFPVP